ncbi:MAG TPA: hypothetical protein VF586_02865, partial [Pyrinomonadaceae bacterium]
MPKLFLTCVAMLASCGAALPVQTPKGAGAKQAPAAEKTGPASKTLDAARLLEDVRALSGDAMEGRGAGTKGGLLARAYVERRFA